MIQLVPHVRMSDRIVEQIVEFFRVLERVVVQIIDVQKKKPQVMEKIVKVQKKLRSELRTRSTDTLQLEKISSQDPEAVH